MDRHRRQATNFLWLMKGRCFQIHALKAVLEKLQKLLRWKYQGQISLSDSGRSVQSIEGSIAEAIDSTFQP